MFGVCLFVDELTIRMIVGGVFQVRVWKAVLCIADVGSATGVLGLAICFRVAR